MPLLRFGHALQLVGAPFGPLFLVAGQGTGGFFDPPPGLVHRARKLVSAPTPAQSARGLLGPTCLCRACCLLDPVRGSVYLLFGPLFVVSGQRADGLLEPTLVLLLFSFAAVVLACLLTHLLILLLWLELLTAPQIYPHPQETLQTRTNTRTLMNSTRRLPLWKMHYTL